VSAPVTDQSPPPRYAHLTGTGRAELADQLRGAYEAGQNLRMLVASTGRSYGFIHQLLVEAGAAMRSRGHPSS